MKLLSALVSGLILMTACGENDKASPGSATAENIAVVNQDPAKVTTIQWLDSAKNLGTIVEGQKVEIAWRFKNAGSNPLIIERVDPSCGCTLADYTKEPIAPGTEGIIKGVFDSQGKPGPNIKTMIVHANIPERTQTLTFTVNVEKKKS